MRILFPSFYVTFLALLFDFYKKHKNPTEKGNTDQFTEHYRRKTPLFFFSYPVPIWIREYHYSYTPQDAEQIVLYCSNIYFCLLSSSIF